MAFYDLSKNERIALVSEIQLKIMHDVEHGTFTKSGIYFSDDDTYIRKSAYLATGKIFTIHEALRNKIVATLEQLLKSSNEKVRQTTVNAAGEIGKTDFDRVRHFFDTGLFDAHHIVRNAVIGSVKKMGEKNPVPVLDWATQYLHHPDKEIRREICHGIELRGRTHPENILPLLEELQFDSTARVRNTLIHVIGQISYKEGCLEKVVTILKRWKNTALVEKALTEIIDVHHRYRNFAAMTQQEARAYIWTHFSPEQ
jgi:hypothetical protein